MLCTKCGNEIPDGSKFCSECGAKIEEVVVTEPTTEVEPAQIEAEAVEVTDETPVYENVTEYAEVVEAPEVISADPVVGDFVSDDSVDTTTEGTEEAEYSNVDSSADEKSEDSSTFESYDSYYEEPKKGLGFSVAALVCGCLSIFCCISGCCELPFVIVAIVFGILAIIHDYEGKGLAIAGLITGIVGLLLAIIMTVAIFASSDEPTEIYDNIYDSIEEVF